MENIGVSERGRFTWKRHICALHGEGTAEKRKKSDQDAGRRSPYKPKGKRTKRDVVRRSIVSRLCLALYGTIKEERKSVSCREFLMGSSVPSSLEEKVIYGAAKKHKTSHSETVRSLPLGKFDCDLASRGSTEWTKSSQGGPGGVRKKGDRGLEGR